MVEQFKSGGSYWGKFLIGIAISILCLYAFSRQVDFSELWKALVAFEWQYMVFAIVSLCVGYSLRILRWSVMLNATGASVRWTDCFAPFMASIGLNNILPLRLGDILRAFVFPKDMGLSNTVALSSLFVERLMDIVTLLGFLLAGLIVVQGSYIPYYFANTVLILGFLGLFGLVIALLLSKKLASYCFQLSESPPFVFEKALFRKFFSSIGALLLSFHSISQAKVILKLLSLSILLWAGECGLFLFTLSGFGLDSTVGVAIIIMSIATLSTLIPSSPGYLGPFHFAVFSALSMLGTDPAQAGSFAVLSHLLLWGATTLVGLAAVIARPRLFRAIKPGYWDRQEETKTTNDIILDHKV